MALNKTLICSQAAYHLGLDGFTDVENETTDAAVILNRLYDWALDLVLREHFWNFAIKRVVLATEVGVPAWGYTKQATLPSDFIREIRINKQSYPYKIENGKLVSNLSTVKLVYVARETNPGVFDPFFAECLALQLAIKASTALTRDDNKKQSLEAQYKRALVKAKRIDASEGDPENIVVEGYPDSIYGLDGSFFGPDETE